MLCIVINIQTMVYFNVTAVFWTDHSLILSIIYFFKEIFQKFIVLPHSTMDLWRRTVLYNQAHIVHLHARLDTNQYRILQCGVLGQETGVIMWTNYAEVISSNNFIIWSENEIYGFLDTGKRT